MVSHLHQSIAALLKNYVSTSSQVCVCVCVCVLMTLVQYNDDIV